MKEWSSSNSYPTIFSIYNHLPLFILSSLQIVFTMTFPSLPQKPHLSPSGLPTFSRACWTPAPRTRLLCVCTVRPLLSWECMGSICCSCLVMALTVARLDSSPCSVILGVQVSLDFPEVANILSNTCEITLYPTLKHSVITQYCCVSYYLSKVYISRKDATRY